MIIKKIDETNDKAGEFINLLYQYSLKKLLKTVIKIPETIDSLNYILCLYALVCSY